MFEEMENKASRGSIPQIILTILNDKSRYGYEICKEIERLTDGKLVMKQPSLYSSLRRLEAQGLVSSTWQESEIGANRHYYSLTVTGKQFYAQNKEQWQLGDLIKKLPVNDFKPEDAEHSTTNDSNKITVASQESLFNLSPTKSEIKRIYEDEKSAENEFFFQFDMFNQNVKNIKNSSTMINKIEKYSNKYEILDNNEADFEPVENKREGNKITSEFHMNKNKFEEMPLTRDYSPRNTYEEDNKSAFDLTELVDENDINTPLFESKSKIVEEKNIEQISTEVSHEVSITKNEVDSQSVTENVKTSDQNLQLLTEEKGFITPIDLSKIERETPVESAQIIESSDYRSVIGKLFSKSQKSDPYEQNKFNSFKEIFPQTNIVNVEKKKESPKSEIDEFVDSSTKSDIECDDIEMLGNLFNLQGIKIRTHKNFDGKNTKQYTDRNKLNMVSSWIVALLMLCETVFTYLFLNNSNYLVKGHLLIFFLAGAMIISIFLVPTLENLFDRYKLVILKVDFKKGLTLRILCFIIVSVVTFAICLAAGMQGLSQMEFMAYWILPVLLSSNIVVSYLIYCLLLKQKYFNM